MIKRQIPKEEDTQIMFVQYLKLQYPAVIAFHIKAGQLLAPLFYLRKLKKLGVRSSMPDFFVSESHGLYHGLYLELKREGTKLKKKNGEWATPHIEQQAIMIERLNRRGYLANFAVGFDQAKKLLDEYLAL